MLWKDPIIVKINEAVTRTTFIHKNEQRKQTVVPTKSLEYRREMVHAELEGTVHY